MSLYNCYFKDDDVRVPFGKAHENARLIVEEHNALETLNKSIKGNLYGIKKQLKL